MYIRRKLYFHGIAACILLIAAGVFIELCCSYTQSFEEIALLAEEAVE